MTGYCAMALTSLAMAGNKALATSTFNYTGGIQSYIVPGGTTSLNISVSGAAGGNADGGLGANGGTTTAILAVTPGQTIYVFVGGKGNNSGDLGGGTTFGYNGGGSLGGGTAPFGAGGGGASDIRVGGTDLYSRVLVAGGGGGAGFSTPAGGGLGGGLVAVAGLSSFTAAGGGNTTLAVGGAGEIGATTTGNSGSFGVGGDIDATGVSGGGGGGYFAGGAGSTDGAGGGGGGSSFAGPSASSPVFTQGDHSGNGVVTITPIVSTHSPVFTHGVTQTLVVCQNSAATPINSLLQINDYDIGNTETWSVVSAPSNGSVGVGPAATSIGGNLTPYGFSYTPAPGANGADAFTIQVYDGTFTTTTTINVLINSIDPIVGAASVCLGSSVALGNAISGGVWSSNIPSVASVSTVGVVTGKVASTATISYNNPSGCAATFIITVTPNPPGISGNSNLCVGSSTTYSEIATGGIWSTGSGNIILDGSGNVTATSAGIATISYSFPSGCYAQRNINVSSLPAAITGPSVVCLGASVYLSDPTTGGVSWKSNDTSIAKATNAGVITGGHSTGVTTITYTVASGCSITTPMTTLANPPSITGNAPVCAGSSFVLADPSGAGSWSSANNAVATAGTDGTITAIAGGTATIYYTDGNGCKTSVVATINAISPITGSLATCVGATTTLGDASPSGTWLSVTPGVATIGATGTVTGVSAGTTTISYSIPSGCVRTATVTVAAGLPAITGNASVCQSFTSALTDAATGGTWTSSLPATVSVNAYGGITAVNVGTATITYTTSACKATQVVTVNANPSNIAGPSKVCTTYAITLSDLVGSGVWTGTNAAGSIDAAGNVTGLTAGTMIATYTIPASGCFKNYTVTVNNTPTPIGGTLTVCTGKITFLNDATNPGLSWSSSTTAVATITASGAATGVAAGTSTITYSLNTGCYITAVLNVNASPANPAAISGPSSVSHGGPGVTLTDATGGGTWTSANPAILSVDALGHVTALVSAGSTTINYIITSGAGCTSFVSKTISTSPAPPTHGGTTTTTVGSQVSIQDEAIGGEWMSSDNNVATIDGNGVVTAVSAGSAIITHTSADSDGEPATTLTHVIVNASAIEAGLFPNPNKGAFAVKGTLGTTKDVAVTFEISNALGQVVYTNNTIATGGIINGQISMSAFASGMYLLNIKSGNETKAIHFVVE